MNLVYKIVKEPQNKMGRKKSKNDYLGPKQPPPP